MSLDAYVIGWIVVNALIGGAIGQTKNRVVAGVVFGVLLGPIGWLLVAVGPNLGRKCQECGGVVEKGVRKCKHCGSSLEPDGTTFNVDDYKIPDGTTSPFGKDG